MSARDALRDIRERAARATEGPWEAVIDNDGRSKEHSVWAELSSDYVAEWMVSRADAEFVTAARTDVPALVEGHEAVLEIHKPEWTSDHHGSGYYRCSADDWTLDEKTPSCPTVTAIETALEGR